MVITILLICTIYILFLSAKYFLVNNIFKYEHSLVGGIDSYDPDYVWGDVTAEVWNILNEIRATEEVYIQSLNDFKNCYIQCFDNFLKDYGMDPIKRFIFYQYNIYEDGRFKRDGKISLMILDQSISLHNELLNILKNIKKNESAIIDVSNWFFSTKLLKLINGYLPFVKNYNAWLNTFNYLMSTYPEFAYYIKNNETTLYNKKRKIDSTIGKESFASMLIKPIQRLPRYELLLTTLQKKVTTQDIQVTNALGNAISHIKYELNRYNEKLKIKTNKEEFFNVLSKLNYPRTIMVNNIDNPLLTLEHLVHGYKSPLVGADVPISLYICNRVIFYVETKVVDTPIFKDENILIVKGMEVISKTEDVLIFKKSKFGTDKFKIIYVPQPIINSQNEEETKQSKKKFTDAITNLLARIKRA